MRKAPSVASAPPRPVDSASNPLTHLAFALLTGKKGALRDLAADSFRVLAGTALESLGGALKQQPSGDPVPYEPSDSDKDER